MGTDISSSEVVRESCVRETLALFSLGLSEVSSRGLWQCIKGNCCVLAVSNDLLLNVRYSLVTDQCRVMGGHEAW